MNHTSFNKVIFPGLLRSGIISLFLISTLVSSSCYVKLNAAFDAETYQLISDISKRTDRFYSMMLETEEAYRNFDAFKATYIDIEVELRSLLVRNKFRPLNKETVRQIEIALGFWEKNKLKHKEEDFINEGDIIINRRYLMDTYHLILLAESAKQS